MDLKKMLLDLFEESKAMLIKPMDFFGKAVKEGEIKVPIIRAAAYSAIVSILFFVFGIFKMGFYVFVAVFGVFFSNFIGLFVGAFIVWIIALIAGSKSTYKESLFILSYLYPVSVVSFTLSEISFFSFGLLSFLSAAAWIYGLYLLYCALVQGLKADGKKILVTGGSIVSVIVVFILLSFITGLVFTGIQSKFVPGMIDKIKNVAGKMQKGEIGVTNPKENEATITQTDKGDTGNVSGGDFMSGKTPQNPWDELGQTKEDYEEGKRLNLMSADPETKKERKKFYDDLEEGYRSGKRQKEFKEIQEGFNKQKEFMKSKEYQDYIKAAEKLNKKMENSEK